MKHLLPRASFLLLVSTSFAIGCADTPAVNPAPQDATVPTDSGVPDAATHPDGDVPTSDATTLISRCDPAQSRLEPVGFDDATYSLASTTRIGCFDHPCVCDPMHPEARRFVEGVLRCDNVAGGYYWGQGSGTIRVRGRSGRNCQLDVMMETEGGARRYQCSVPMPIVSWSGLMTSGDTTMGGVSLISGIESYCTESASCSLIPGLGTACGSDVVQCETLGTNRCSAAP